MISKMPAKKAWVLGLEPLDPQYQPGTVMASCNPGAREWGGWRQQNPWHSQANHCNQKGRLLVQ